MRFFFSSRRRHTRYWRDWSSDVCSSDLGPRPRERHVERAPAVAARARRPDAAAARLDDLPADGEAEAFAGDLGVSRRAESRREDLLKVVRLHAGALIADRDDHLIVGRRDLDDDR